jgi:fumarate reductase (CoM/CoB) subunit A
LSQLGPGRKAYLQGNLRLTTNPKIEQIETDVLIIGAGIAGMMGAVAAVRYGITPLVGTKGSYASGSSSMARGGHAVAIGHSDPDDNPDIFAEDILTASYGLANPRLADVMARGSIERTMELDDWGLGLVKLDDGRFDQKRGAFPHRYARNVHCGKLMGKPLMNAVSAKTKDLGIEPLTHIMFVDLLKDGEQVVGAWGFKYRDGTPVVVHARATVLSTGGAPQLHTINDSPPTITGDGYSMAYRAGAELIDMEFIDYQMVTAAPEKLAGYPPHSSGFLNAGGFMLNADGERFIERYDAENMERTTRSMMSRAVAMEIYEGRATKNNAVLMDIRHCFDACNRGSMADLIKMYLKSGVDLRTDFLELAICPHTYLGGLRIDEWGRTSLLGLYAGGEAAGGIHGANRLGGAALTDSYVFGYRSGLTAAIEAANFDKPDPSSGGWKDAIAELEDRAARKTGAAPEDWRQEVQDLVVTTFGQVRGGNELEIGFNKLDQLEAAYKDMGTQGTTPRERFNCLRLSFETLNLIQVARMLGTAALARGESRGGHFRLDHPDQDDTNYLGNIVLWRKDHEICYEFRPVPANQPAPAPPGM